MVVRREHVTGQLTSPAFFQMRSGGLGSQVGARSTDFVLLIMSEHAVQRLLEDKCVLGANISVATGPVGRGLSAETHTGFESGMLSYSRARGLFAGVSLTGATMEADKPANAVYYGEGITVQDVFYENRGASTENVSLLRRFLHAAVQPAGNKSEKSS